MKYKIEKYIEKHQLMEKESPVLVALSGGADSVALLLVLHNLGYKCQAIHCNFHLRGEESNRDEEFVTSLCKILGITLDIVHFDTTEYAKSHGISIEMAARELRYDAFEKQRKLIDAQAIAVAHHRDDSAETLLLNLVRGTGIRGLRGIQPKNGYIIRPLLCVGREDIIDYLKWRGQDFITDSTNLTSDYTRNKIRLEVIPKLAEINPSIKESLAGTAQRVSEAELIYRHAVGEAVKRVKTENSIDIELLKKEIAPATLLHEILSPLGFNSKQTEDIYDSLDKMAINGEVRQEEVAELKRQISNTLDNSIAGEWFDGNWEHTLCERNIILPDGGTKRPDRVMTRGEEAVVVDYKFGEENPAHNKQIASYIQKLKSMNYTKVSGYIWYVSAGKIVQIEL
jgi:tRNA(Ile)-lysidine synthase